MAAIGQDFADDGRAGVLKRTQSQQIKSPVNPHRDNMQGKSTDENANLLLRNPRRHNILEMPLQNIIEIRPSKMTRSLQPRQRRVRRRFGPIAIEEIPEDVSGDVLALRRNVRVDVELEVAGGSQGAGAVDGAV